MHSNGPTWGCLGPPSGSAAGHELVDGEGRCLHNVFVERLWRTVKYEQVYPSRYESLVDARQKLLTYFEFYNRQRPHSEFGIRTPWEVYHAEDMALAA
jgi:transposase InsO family protein